MKRVLFVIESLSGGGAEKVLATLVRHLDREQFHATVCPIVDTGQWVDEVKQNADYRPVIMRAGNGVLSRLWYQVKYRLVYSLLPLSWVYRLFIPKGNDVEVAFCEGYVTRLMAHSTNRHARRLAWVHIDLHNFHWTRSVYHNDHEEEWCYDQYNHIATVSRTATEAFRREFPGVTTAVSTLYNPIDSDAIRKMAASVDSSEFIVNSSNAEGAQIPSLSERSGEKVRLITAGRFTKQKAFVRLLRIVKQLRDEGRAIELWILGDGELRSQYEQYIHDNQLQDIVTLWGFQKNPYPFIAQSDLFVCSSLSEGYSTAVTESLILGVPVVTTRCSGMDELLSGGTFGGIITDNDEQALLDGLKSILDSKTRLSELKVQAIHRGKDFTIQSLLSPIQDLLQ